MLLAVTDFFTSWAWALALSAVTLGAVVATALRTEWGQYTKDRLLLAIPVIGSTIHFALVERFCRVLASMVSAGVSLPEALRVATESVHNRVYTRTLGGVSEAVLEGQGLATPLTKAGLFPAVAAQMLRVGEETGTLDTQLALTADYYESELEYKIKKLAAMFEPAVIIVMGIVVGFVAIALVSAMYGVFRQVKI
jgi:type IV pilus assembly protein PilC